MKTGALTPIMRNPIVFGLLGLQLLLTAGAAISTTAVRIGDNVVLLPAPAGFVEASRQNSSMHRFALLLTPARSQFLAFYVTNNDWQRLQQRRQPQLTQYAVVHISKSMVSKNVSQQGFNKLRNLVRKRYGTKLQQVRQRAQTHLNAVVKKFMGDNARGSLQVGHIRPLGISYDSRNTISYAMLTKYILKTGSRKQQVVMIGTISFALVQGKLLKLYVFRHFQGYKDLDWVKQTTRHWIRQIQRHNRS